MMDYLANPSIGKEKCKVYVQMIQKNTRRLEDNVRDLLYIAQIQEQYLAIKTKPVLLSELVEAVVNNYEELARLKGRRILRDYKEGVRVVVDQDKMKKVISNLLSNALKFSKHGDNRVKLRKNKNFVICEIQDNGKGIPKKDLR